MMKISIPFKAAIGYCAVAVVLIAAIALVYSNTQSILAINKASREYIEKRDSADNAMAALLKDEQDNLKQLSDAMEGNARPNYLHEKLQNLNTGKDSVVVHQKTAQTHEAKTTTVEVVKTKKGFFRRLADAFKKEHAETLSVKKDSNRAVIDTIAPVNVADNVADILEQIDKKEKNATKEKSHAVNKEMAELQMVNAQLALRSAKQLNEEHERERLSMQQTINKAIAARQHLLWQIGMLAVVAFLATIILLWYIWRDTQKERIYRENLEAANEEIQRIMKQRERLLLTITHDIKAPAASISGFIDLLKECLHDEQALSYLNSIRNSATHLSQLVASLLDYHQLENGLMELHPASFNPQKLVEQCVEEMNIQAQQKSLALNYDIQGLTNNPSIYRADAFRIRQILNNLVSNAIKYTDHGSVNINASIHQGKYPGSQGTELILKVCDTGKGMTTEESQRIFQAFTRLKSAQGIEGTGLGLSITQELTTLLGGSIQLTSTKGKGSIFTVTLPVEPCPKEQDKTKEQGKPQKATKQTSTDAKETPDEASSMNKKELSSIDESVSLQTLQNHKILILDDDKLQLTLLQEILNRIIDKDWQVFACNHVSEALTVLHNEQPSLMLMDIEMPEMSGMELIKHINHSHMKVFAMTAHDESIIKDLKLAGFNDCLFKPFTKENLAHKLGIEKGDEKEEKKEGKMQKKAIKRKGEGEEKEKREEKEKKIEGKIEGKIEKKDKNREEKEKTEELSKSNSEETREENTEETREENTEETREGNSKRLESLFAPLLVFAEGDIEAEREMLDGLKTEMLNHYAAFQQVAGCPNDTIHQEQIAKAAHKLTPIAAMLKLESLEAIKALTPEQIDKLDEPKIRAYALSVATEIEHTLKDIDLFLKERGK